jgi:putative membrane protein
MIVSYYDHAANERTFLAWVRSALSSVALGIVVKKGSLLAVLVASASSLGISGSAQDPLSNYGGSALIGAGIAAIAGAGIRFVHTALRIDDDREHSAGIVRLTAALLGRARPGTGQAGRALAYTRPSTAGRRSRILNSVREDSLKLVAGTDVREIR